MKAVFERLLAASETIWRLHPGAGRAAQARRAADGRQKQAQPACPPAPVARG